MLCRIDVPTVYRKVLMSGEYLMAKHTVLNTPITIY